MTQEQLSFRDMQAFDGSFLTLKHCVCLLRSATHHQVAVSKLEIWAVSWDLEAVILAPSGFDIIRRRTGQLQDGLHCNE